MLGLHKCFKARSSAPIQDKGDFYWEVKISLKLQGTEVVFWLDSKADMGILCRP